MDFFYHYYRHRDCGNHLVANYVYDFRGANGVPNVSDTFGSIDEDGVERPPKVISEHDKPAIETPQVQLLRACRQIHQEAWPIFWSTTTFSFNDVDSLQEFMNDRTALEKQSIRKLSLWPIFDDDEEMRWGGVLGRISIDSLYNLRELHICFHNAYFDYWEFSKSRYEGIEDFLRFRTLSLQTVTVTWHNSHTYDFGNMGSWTHERRTEIADYIRERLIRPLAPSEEARLQKNLARPRWIREDDHEES